MNNTYNPFTLEGKTILITGASSGIGKAVAIECSKAGATIIITGRSAVRLNETYELLAPGLKHSMFQADLAQKIELKTLIEYLPQLDGIVHCAGMLKKLPLKFISEESLIDTMQTNFYSPALISQLAVRHKKLINGASIVFISSIASHVASIGNIMYMASKGALNSLARGMALELADKKIRVNCIEPALVKTNLTSVMTSEDLDNYEKKFPLGRFGQPEEIAYGAIYLLSNATQWITGSTLTIDGGITLR